MLKGVHDERSENGKEKANAPVGRENGGAGARGRTRGRRPSVPSREYCARAAVAVEAEISAGRNRKSERHQARAEASGKSDADRNEDRDREAIAGAAGNFDRTSGDKKKNRSG